MEAEAYGIGVLVTGVASAFLSGRIVLGATYNELKERCERESAADKAEIRALHRALWRLKGIITDEMGIPLPDDQEDPE